MYWTGGMTGSFFCGVGLLLLLPRRLPRPVLCRLDIKWWRYFSQEYPL